MNRNIIIGVVIMALGLLSSCNSGYTRRTPGKTYVPDMVYSRAYDAYTENPNTANGLTSQEPIAGTIARGQALPDHLTEDDTSAYYSMKNPYTFSEEDMVQGKRLYDIQCGICHGAKLDGNGPLYNGGDGKYLAKPANFTDATVKAMSDGRYYYTIMYGKNMMGSYASQLNHNDRWKVIAYIRSKTGAAKEEAATSDAAAPKEGDAKAADEKTETVAAK